MAVDAVTMDSPRDRPWYRWYVVGVLTLAYVLSFIDRQIISLMVGPIKQDLGLTDTQISYLLGLSFAIFYTLFGFLIAMAADRFNRRNIIIAGIVIWSAMTAACGLAKSFGQLFFARMGVGFGEGALSPAALSMISDYFPKDKLARALSVYAMGVSVGTGIALLLGGQLVAAVSTTTTTIVPLLGELRPWQLAFVLVALPGLPMALLMLTVREPARRGRQSEQTTWSLAPAIAHYRQHAKTYTGIYFGMSVLTIMAYGIGGWIPEHFRRTYGWEIGDIALTYGTILIVFGPIGALLGGWLADRWQARHGDGYLRAVLFGLVLLVPGYTLFALMPTAELSLLFLIPATLGGAIPTSVAKACLMKVAPNELRAVVAALYYFIISVIGLGVGPTSVALLTDQFFADESQLKYSLALVAGVAGTAAFILVLWVRPHFRRSAGE